MSALAVEGILGGGALGVERVGKRCPVVWDAEWSDAKKDKNTMHTGIYCLPIGKPKYNNQAATEGSMEEIYDEWDAWGKRDAIIFGVL